MVVEQNVVGHAQRGENDGRRAAVLNDDDHAERRRGTADALNHRC
jgi:hypothetical protein